VFNAAVVDVVGHCFGISKSSSNNKVLVDGVSLVLIVQKEDGVEQLKQAAQQLIDDYGFAESSWYGIAAITSSTALADLTSVISVSVVSYFSSCPLGVILGRAVHRLQGFRILPH
jgi:hypothetical protein